ncbi:MAG: hypothetical protein WC368_04115, partial [Candidatus Cloacimonadaceae bacterium]
MYESRSGDAPWPTAAMEAVWLLIQDLPDNRVYLAGGEGFGDEWNDIAQQAVIAHNIVCVSGH